jgi:hypothetical protein
MPSHRRFRSLALAAVLTGPMIFAPAIVFAAPAEDPQPKQAAPPPVRTEQVRMRAASPNEVAAIISGSLHISAIPSERSGVVVISGTDPELAAASKQIEQLELAARERLRDEEVLAANRAEQQAMLNARRSVVIEFAGGTVGSYIELVRKATSFENVIVASEGIMKLDMPSVQLKRVTPTAAIMLLQSMRFASGGQSVALKVDMVPGDPSGEGIESEPVLVIDLASPGSARAITQPMQTEVFDLAVYQKVEPERLKQLLEAISIATEMSGKKDGFQMRLHEGTGLLLVRGSPEDLEIVFRTVRAFTGQSKSSDQSQSTKQ